MGEAGGQGQRTIAVGVSALVASDQIHKCPRREPVTRRSASSLTYTTETKWRGAPSQPASVAVNGAMNGSVGGMLALRRLNHMLTRCATFMLLEWRCSHCDTKASLQSISFATCRTVVRVLDMYSSTRARTSSAKASPMAAAQQRAHTSAAAAPQSSAGPVRVSCQQTADALKTSPHCSGVLAQTTDR